MKRKLTTFLIISAILLGMAQTALAHDGWIQTNTPLVRTGETAYVDLQYGNHSAEHGSYRIAGKWGIARTKLFVIAPSGQKIDISGSLFDTGEHADVSPAGQKGYFSAAFVPGAPGAYILSVEGDSIFTSAGGSSRTLRSAKTFVAAADLPLRERVAALTAFMHPAAPDRAELVPLVNPLGLNPGSNVTVRLIHKGQPVPNQYLTVVRRSNSERTDYTTDGAGEITFTAGPADFYLIRAKYDNLEEKKEGEYDKTAYEATLTFLVERALPTAPSGVGLPVSVWVNGARLVLTSSTGTATVVSDRTFVPLRAIGESLGASFGYNESTNTVTIARGGTTVSLPVGQLEATVNGSVVSLDSPAFVENGRTMVPVRFIAEALAARVEYLPATFGIGAAVLVYQTN